MKSSTYDMTAECKSYIKDGYTIFPLTQFAKTPIFAGWPDLEGKKKYKPEDFEDRNIGLLLGTQHDGKYLSAIDIDVYSEAKNMYANQICEFLKIENPVIQNTASGGIHIFIKTDKPLPKADIKVEGGHIELRSTKHYVVLAPSIVKSEKTGETHQYQMVNSLAEIPEVSSSLVEEYFRINKPGQDVLTKKIVTHNNTEVQETTTIIHDKTHDLIVDKYGIINAYQMLGVNGHACGNYLKANCPVHDDKNPSFSVHYDTGKAYCHTARASYNIPGLAKALYGDDYKRQIREIFDVDITSYEFDPKEYSNKSIADNLGVKGEIVYYDKYISDAKLKDGILAVDTMLTDQYNYTAISKTGSGKTTTMVTRGKALGLKIVIAAPTIPLTEQIAKDHNAIAITGTTSSSEIGKAIDNPKTTLICATYDSVQKLFEFTDFRTSDYILVIDEVHNLVTAQGFRASTLNTLVELSAYFTKTIYLTGTPEGVVIPNNSKVIKFQKRIEDKKPKVKILDYCFKGLEHLALHLIKNYQGGIIVVYIDNIENLELLKEILITRKYFKKDEISFVTAESKDEEDYQSIILKSQLKPGTKILLTTQVIAEGVNIKDYDVRSIYTLNSRNTIAVRQMSARFRNANKGELTIYEFLTHGVNLKMIDFQESFEFMLENAEYLLNKEKEYREKHNLILNPDRPRFYASIFKDTIEKSFYYYDRRIGDYVINKYKIAAHVHNEIQSILLKNYNFRAEYYRTFEGWHVSIEDLEIEFINMEEIKDEKILRDEARYKSTIELLDKFPQETITAYCRYVDSKFGMDNGWQLYGLLLNTDMKEFYNQNKKLLGSKKGKEAVDSFVKLYKLKLSHNFIMNLLDKDNKFRNKIIEKLLGFYTMQIIDKPKLQAMDKRDGVSVKRAAILNWIVKNVLSKSEIIPNDILDHYNAMLISVGCAPETQTSMMRNIREIVNLNRRNRREEKETINFYEVKGPHTPESILMEAKMEMSEEYINAIKAAADIWLKRKLSNLSYLDESVSLSPEYLLNNIRTEVTQPKKNKLTAEDEWPFIQRLSA
ncbi:MAG: bifunctional DNA primase/polymerase [Ignavibacteriaceae bacterium]